MKNNKWACRVLSVLLSAVMLVSCTGVAAFADGGQRYTYGDTEAVKITNPTTVSGEDDGITLGGDRLNSYAWAVAARGDYIYIGTNRAYISTEVWGTLARMGPALGAGDDLEALYEICNYFTYGELPDYTKLTDEDLIPEIIRLDPKTGETKVLELPQEFLDICTKEERCAFRSVVEQDGNLYFGSYGSNYVFLIRVDENDRATVAYIAGEASTGAHIQYNSMRACGVYDGKQYFGGSSSDLPNWDSAHVPLFIAEMKDEGYDPDGADRQDVQFDNYIADYRDFAEYADPADPSVGNQFYDLVNYDGWFYTIISDSVGFAVYRGHPAAEGEQANDYGWHWELAVDGAGDPDSPARGFIAATPYVYNGELYIGTFSSIAGFGGTAVQLVLWINDVMNVLQDPEANIRNISTVLAPLYNLMKKDAKVFRLEDGKLVEVPDACEQLVGKCAVYLWRFIEFDGEMYMTTFDASILFGYILDISIRDILSAILDGLNDTASLLEQNPATVETQSLGSLYASVSALIRTLRESGFEGDGKDENKRISLTADQMRTIYAGIRAVRTALDRLNVNSVRTVDAPASWLDDMNGMIASLQKILNSIDDTGVDMYVSMKEQLAANTQGFDLLKTADGDAWEYVIDDGFNDKYNYGGRTLVIYDEHLYLGTANPFYGAQVWRFDDVVYPTETRCVSVYNSYANEDGSGVYEAGQTVTVNAGSRANYSFAGWSGNVELEDSRSAETSFVMPSYDVALAAAWEYSGSTGGGVVYVPVAPEAPEGPVNPFIDVFDDDYYYDSVLWAVGSGVTTGTSEDTFSPYDGCTRAQVVTFLWREAGCPVVDCAMSFADVPADAYFAEAVRWAVSEGITNGTGEETFSPDDICTRAQIVTFLWRAVGSPVCESELKFSDVSDDDYYAGAVAWAVANGVTTGTGENTFSPTAACTRAQTVTFLYRNYGK